MAQRNFFMCLRQAERSDQESEKQLATGHRGKHRKTKKNLYKLSHAKPQRRKENQTRSFYCFDLKPEKGSMVLPFFAV
ncbi:MAG: hypothetical protein NDI77_12440 [Geobacteraceae bacterium]|nr:hypothetical protein [Geobacteraceae bacterium]